MTNFPLRKIWMKYFLRQSVQNILYLKCHFSLSYKLFEQLEGTRERILCRFQISSSNHVASTRLLSVALYKMDLDWKNK